jgi:hypothetical protein
MLCVKIRGMFSPGHLPPRYIKIDQYLFSNLPERKRNSMTDSEQNNEPISEPLKTPREKKQYSLT